MYFMYTFMHRDLCDVYLHSAVVWSLVFYLVTSPVMGLPPVGDFS